jgi:hypothetical protein
MTSEQLLALVFEKVHEGQVTLVQG